MINKFWWKCPICGFEAKTPDEQDNHMLNTGHLTYANLEDNEKETSEKLNDLMRSKHFGYKTRSSKDTSKGIKPKNKKIGNKPL